ncbi:MAG: serine/threonine protein kinase [Planctomycetes bacterium]|nr:serine/threonine protein kinase [Planctomycetota bacterium]
MTEERSRRRAQVFEDALDCPPEQRDAFVARACGTDRELCAEIESLLQHHRGAEAGFLSPPDPPGQDAHPECAVHPAPRIGTKLGGYTLTAIIARGGMGTVYLAEQENPKRSVAVKVLNAEIASRQATKRFEFESRILAHLHHPHISQVYEAGIHVDDATGERGLPYLVMEYLSGALPITEHAERNGLGIRDRLERFAQVCDAVQYGHQKGIIHRDLKPGNILVDEAGHVKVVDFGVARSFDTDVTLTTMQTEVGQLIGTLQYMSPEQCDADPNQIDTRSDVYSLGVVLYELLTGNLPYDTAGSSIYQATRLIKEATPTRPSSLSRRLRGDLETIVLKALEKNPEHRYQSASDLARDIRRHLSGKPIEARPPTDWARAGQWLIAHPVITTATCCLVAGLAIVAGTWITVWIVNERPYKVVQVDPQEVRLLSASGNILHFWSTQAPGQVNLLYNGLIGRPGAMGGGRLAVLAFSSADNYPYADSACVFDIDHNLTDPVLELRIKPGELLPERHARVYKPQDFSVCTGGVFDIFPELPGLEIVVVYSHEAYSQCFVRVYDLEGAVKYQVWHDGTIGHCRWLPDAELLVLFGNNAEAFWEDRGVSGVNNQHPLVLFAVRPKPGSIMSGFLQSAPGDGPLEPVWYRCLHPSNAADLLDDWGFDEAGPNEGDPGKSLRIRLELATDRRSHVRVSWDVDEKGIEIPHSRVVSDNYNRNRANLPEGHPDRLPDPELFQLGDLPPIIPESDGGRTLTTSERVETQRTPIDR